MRYHGTLPLLALSSLILLSLPSGSLCQSNVLLTGAPSDLNTSNETMPPTMEESVMESHSGTMTMTGIDDTNDTAAVAPLPDDIMEDTTTTMAPTERATMMATIEESIILSMTEIPQTMAPTERATTMGSTVGDASLVPVTRVPQNNDLTVAPTEGATMVGTASGSASSTSFLTPVPENNADTMPPTQGETMMTTESVIIPSTATSTATTVPEMPTQNETMAPTEEASMMGSEIEEMTEIPDDDTMETTMIPITISPSSSSEGENPPLSDGTCSIESPCDMCEGDCDNDSDCAGSMECYRRSGNSQNPVPGCAGAGIPGQDYCFVPEDNHLRLRDTQCSSEHPCSSCEGDCDNDFQCQGELSCYQIPSGETESVPGCIGVANGLDYCYNWNGCRADSDCPPLPCTEEPCDQHVCRDSQCVIVASCGPNVCAVGEYCCNESCGVCAPAGGGCTQQFCDTQCGPSVCEAGDICCNESCGICTPPRDACTQQSCADGDIRRRVLEEHHASNMDHPSFLRKA